MRLNALNRQTARKHDEVRWDRNRTGFLIGETVAGRLDRIERLTERGTCGLGRAEVYWLIEQARV